MGRCPPRDRSLDRAPTFRDWVIRSRIRVTTSGPDPTDGDVYGECASSGELKLLDLCIARSFVRACKGPKFGIEGIRELVGAPDPTVADHDDEAGVGLTPKESAGVFYEAAIGGSDGVKDDERWSRTVEHYLDRPCARNTSVRPPGLR